MTKCIYKMIGGCTSSDSKIDERQRISKTTFLEKIVSSQTEIEDDIDEYLIRQPVDVTRTIKYQVLHGVGTST